MARRPGDEDGLRRGMGGEPGVVAPGPGPTRTGHVTESVGRVGTGRRGAAPRTAWVCLCVCACVRVFVFVFVCVFSRSHGVCASRGRCVRHTVAEHGLRALYASYPTTVAMNIPVTHPESAPAPAAPHRRAGPARWHLFINFFLVIQTNCTSIAH